MNYLNAAVIRDALKSASGASYNANANPNVGTQNNIANNDIEREVRFGTLEHEGRKSFLSRGNFNTLKETLISSGIEFTKIVSDANIWKGGLRFENNQLIRKTQEYFFSNRDYGISFAVSRETKLPINQKPKLPADTVRHKTRYSFMLDDQYRLDLTEVVETRNNSDNDRQNDNRPINKYEVELEAPAAINVDVINLHIDSILRLLYETQIVFKAYEKFETFDQINKVLHSDWVAAINNNLLGTTVNIKPDNISSVAGNSALFPINNKILCQATIKIDGKRRFLWLGPYGVYLIAPVDFFNKVNIVVNNYNLPQHLYFTLFEGEFLNNIFYAYDTIIYGNKYYRNKSHTERLSCIQDITRYNGLFPDLTIIMKKFFPFNIAPQMYDVVNHLLSDIPQSLPTDGIIITPNISTSGNQISYKWKPASHLTIDFLYSNSILYTYNNNSNEPFKEFPYGVKLLTNTGKEVVDNSIVELAFERDVEGELHPVFVRYREDKPTPNATNVARDVWNDIDRPIPEAAMKGQEFYFIFRHHNRVKDMIYSKISLSSTANRMPRSILVIGSGKGGDVTKQIKYGFDTIVNVEPNAINTAALVRRTKDIKHVSITNLTLYGQDVEGIMKSSPVKQFDCLVYMLSLSFFFDTKDSTLSVIKLAKKCLKPGGYFACLSIDGNKLLAMKQVPGYFFGNKLNLNQVWLELRDNKQVFIDIPSSKTVHNQIEYLTNLDYLGKLFIANGFKSVSQNGNNVEDVPIDLGLNPEETTFNSLYSYMIFQKL